MAEGDMGALKTTVTLRIMGIMEGDAPVNIEMPAATTGRYAAKRAAKACGMDPETYEWGLYMWGTAGYGLVAMQDPVSDLEGRNLILELRNSN